MISAWFLFRKKSEALIDKSLLRLVFKTTIFSVSGYGIYCLVNKTFNLGTFVSSVGWVHSNYGFIFVYVIVALVHPLLNELANLISELTLKRICFIGFVFVEIFKGAYNVHFTFIIIYLTIAYIKKYKIDQIKKEWCIWSFIICSTTVKAIQIVCQIYAPEQMAFTLDEESDIFVLCNALSIFIFVAKSSPFYNRGINFIAKGMVTVYLIHENSWLRFGIWKFFQCESFYASSFMIIHGIACSCVIMVLGVVIGCVYDHIEYWVDAKWIRKE